MSERKENKNAPIRDERLSTSLHRREEWLGFSVVGAFIESLITKQTPVWSMGAGVIAQFVVPKAPSEIINSVVQKLKKKS